MDAYLGQLFLCHLITSIIRQRKSIAEIEKIEKYSQKKC